MKIDKPGVYRLTMEQYHGQPCAGPSVSSSGLRTIFMRSPAHYWVEASLNPNRLEAEEKDAFVLGRAAHHLLLGEDDFSTQFIARPEMFDSWRTKESKQWKAQEEAKGNTVLLQSQLDVIRGMARTLADHPLVKAGILNGEIEQSLLWKDAATGIWLKSRPDAIPNDSGDFADLKTASFVGFDLDREVSNLRYDMQAALTKWAAKAVLDLDMASFSFVFVEKKPPHCVDVLTLDKEDIAAAERDLRTAVDTFAWCVENNNWFGPAGTQSDARYVHLSDWARKNAEFRRDFLKREIERAEIVPTEADYMGAG